MKWPLLRRTYFFSARDGNSKGNLGHSIFSGKVQLQSVKLQIDSANQGKLHI